MKRGGHCSLCNICTIIGSASKGCVSRTRSTCKGAATNPTARALLCFAAIRPERSARDDHHPLLYQLASHVGIHVRQACLGEGAGGGRPTWATRCLQLHACTRTCPAGLPCRGCGGRERGRQQQARAVLLPQLLLWYYDHPSPQIKSMAKSTKPSKAYSKVARPGCIS
jgi:hypothetical protein